MREMLKGAAGQLALDVRRHHALWRGGLVLRTLLAVLTRQGGAAKVRIGRVILVAGPN